MRTVFCPVSGRQVNGTECLEIVLVADRMMNASTLPPEIRWDEGQRQTCLRCYYHDDKKAGDDLSDRAAGGRTGDMEYSGLRKRAEDIDGTEKANHGVWHPKF